MTLAGITETDTAAPAVSVVMAVKDCERFVEASVRAVLAQRFQSFELIVIEDGSSDSTPEILARLASEDRRLRILWNDTNIGLARSLNRGFDAARGTFVARMDGDDLAAPDWLGVLHAFLSSNPKTVFVGASIREIDEAGRHLRFRHLAHRPAEMRWSLRFHSPVVHPSVMIRRSALEEPSPLRYDPAFSSTEDYDLFTRLSGRGEGANLPDVLVSYRVHANSISQTRWREQIRDAKIIAEEVQKAEFPPELYVALAGVRAAFFDLERVPPARILAGLRAVLRFDRNRVRRGWAAQESMRLYNMAMRRTGRRRRSEILLGVLFAAPDIGARAIAARLSERFRRARRAAIRPRAASPPPFLPTAPPEPGATTRHQT